VEGAIVSSKVRVETWGTEQRDFSDERHYYDLMIAVGGGDWKEACRQA